MRNIGVARERESSNLNKGITLIALIVTIIVLLILAGVAVVTLTGENGILGKAKLAKENTEQKMEEEQDILNSYQNEMDGYLMPRTTVSQNYSTKEVQIGTWINEKPIYQKVIELNQSLNSLSSYKSIDIDYIPVDELLYIDCFYRVPHSENGYNSFSTAGSLGSVYYKANTDKTKGTISIQQNETSGNAAYVTSCIMQYTKTTETVTGE